MQDQDKPAALVRAVAGIDAAITARHHFAVREFFDDGTEHLSRFTVDPTLAGLERLSQRLAAVPAPLTAVVEPTSMTWLALALAVERVGGQMEMIGARHSSRLRGAIMGKNKSDVIDSEVLTPVGEIFDPPPLMLASPGQLALHRAVVRRAGAVIDGNRYWRRLLSLARWAFPDVWSAFAGSESTALAVLGRWPHLRSLASVRAATLTAVVAGRTRDVADTPSRATAIKTAARGWADFILPENCQSLEAAASPKRWRGPVGSNRSGHGPRHGPCDAGRRDPPPNRLTRRHTRQCPRRHLNRIAGRCVRTWQPTRPYVPGAGKEILVGGTQKIVPDPEGSLRRILLPARGRECRS
jgi:hypothetical protein